MKPLVIYYSRTGQNYVNGQIKDLHTGNTDKAAHIIAETVGADLFELEPKFHYSDDYNTAIEEVKQQMADGIQIEVKELPDVSGYDPVFVGYPIWWGTCPSFVISALEGLDLSGKRICPFCTNEGSNLGTSEHDIRKACPGARVKEGLAIHGAEVDHHKRTIEDWTRKHMEN